MSGIRTATRRLSDNVASLRGMAKKRCWDDDQLREAVATSTSYVAVLRALGLSGQGAAHWTVKRRIAELGLDVAHIEKRRWSREELLEATTESKSFVETLERLGLTPDAASHTRLRRSIRRHSIDVSHFVRGPRSRERRSRWSDEQLTAAVRGAKSMAAVLRSLGVIAAGGNYEVMWRHVKRLALDTSHFTGTGSARGKNVTVRAATPLDDVLVNNRWMTSHHLKQRLIAEGMKPEHCEMCGWAQRAPDGRLPLELDHINGDRTDNRRENLRILCPNCHSLQPTHRGRNKKSFRSRNG